MDMLGLVHIMIKNLFRTFLVEIRDQLIEVDMLKKGDFLANHSVGSINEQKRFELKPPSIV